jgi:hypothetical protein
MVHAHVPDEFYDFALEHAWKIFNCLPIKSKNNDNPVPQWAYTGRKPHLARFRVLFCPCVIGMGEANQVWRNLYFRGNCLNVDCEVYTFSPRYQEDGWLCFLPSTGRLRVCADVAFDNFYSTLAFSPNSRHLASPALNATFKSLYRSSLSWRT